MHSVGTARGAARVAGIRKLPRSEALGSCFNFLSEAAHHRVSRETPRSFSHRGEALSVFHVEHLQDRPMARRSRRLASRVYAGTLKGVAALISVVLADVGPSMRSSCAGAFPSTMPARSLTSCAISQDADEPSHRSEPISARQRQAALCWRSHVCNERQGRRNIGRVDLRVCEGR